MDFNDDDGPPQLVEVDLRRNVAQEETKEVKVPITIVTVDIEADLDLRIWRLWVSLLLEWYFIYLLDSGVTAIESLMEKKGAFDYILLETTGLADPGNLAPLFWVDEGLGSTIYLDGIVTLIDAKNILKSLDEPVQETIQHDGHQGPVLTTAHLQISHADVLVINKSDLVSDSDLQAVKDRVQAINGLAKLYVTQQGQVPQLDGFLLDLHAYDDVGVLDVAEKGHSHLDPTISTVTVTVPILTLEQLPKVDAWLRSLLWDTKLPNLVPNLNSSEGGIEIHRLKARLPFTNGDVKIVQGVREIFDILDGKPERNTTTPISDIEGKIVLIGRHMSELRFKESFINTINSL
ncbi:hypothetical protein B7494_g7267 [Chlorociboria aeruginascens]|nr:hypothetical protein B7494_g7267 [Chlorociboria aeruginascens]